MTKLGFLVGCITSLGFLLGGSSMGCGGAASTNTGGSGGASNACEAGTFRNCKCAEGGQGQQSCENGKWGACVECTSFFDAGNGTGGSDAAPMCGDNECNGTENCVNCPADCGECPACSLAPSCTGASSVPSSPEALASFNNNGQTMYTSGVGLGMPPGSTDCSDPLLKMRVSQVVIHKNGDPGSLHLFCLVQADDGQSSQLMLTPDWMNISDNNPPLILSPAQGTFWGEATNGIKLSQFNITVTYQCFMELQPSALQNALMAISQFAGAAAAIPGNPYGWAFGVGGAAAAAAAAAAATGSGATPLLNVQQTIDQSSLLTLTNGRTWVIEQTGSTTADGQCGFFGSCDWDWELDVEAWGCAAPKGQTPQM
jgi:hypothetical protein